MDLPVAENLPKKSGLEIKADWPTLGVLISGYYLLKLTKRALVLRKTT